MSAILSAATKPDPMSTPENPKRLALARLAGWIDGNRHGSGCQCSKCHGNEHGPGLRQLARRAIADGCPFETEDGDDLVSCGECYVCQISHAVNTGRI